MLKSYLKPRPTVQMFSGSVPFNLRVLTLPPIFHPEKNLHRYSHHILLPRSNLGLPEQKSSIPPASTSHPALCALTP